MNNKRSHSENLEGECVPTITPPGPSQKKQTDPHEILHELSKHIDACDGSEKWNATFTRLCYEGAGVYEGMRHKFEQLRAQFGTGYDGFGNEGEVHGDRTVKKQHKSEILGLQHCLRRCLLETIESEPPGNEFIDELARHTNEGLGNLMPGGEHEVSDTCGEGEEGGEVVARVSIDNYGGVMVHGRCSTLNSLFGPSVTLCANPFR
ncbi:unnamed protein product [Zymoseptoria tritici ST99CH_1E4]|uniref:Uncharacterized protein n=1 Tax=Zymoseptoria tritici ST99CH_1E4 TaxID=1276532 RepID=A0A2H1FZQ6_ZYMTR|nr:unnamed protein product [Zymoseptoria tritici ST99CH_1E4]